MAGFLCFLVAFLLTCVIVASDTSVRLSAAHALQDQDPVASPSPAAAAPTTPPPSADRRRALQDPAVSPSPAAAAPTAPPPSAAPSIGPAPPAPPPPSAFSRCAPADLTSDAVVRLKRTWVCVEILQVSGSGGGSSGGGSAGTGSRAVFDPVADEFSSVLIAGSFHHYAGSRGGGGGGSAGAGGSAAGGGSGSAESGGGSLSGLNTSASVSAGATLVVVSSLGASSSVSSSTGSLPGGAKLYMSADGNTVFPLYTAVITVVDGAVKLVSFDEGCDLCPGSGSQCAANAPDSSAGQTSCFVPRAQCVDVPLPAGSSASSNSCDLKIYFVWQGTAADGTPFSSTSRRLSRFSAWPLQVQQLWQRVQATSASAVQGLLPASAPVVVNAAGNSENS